MNEDTFVRHGVRGDGMACWIAAFFLYISLFPYFVWSIEPYSSWFISLPLFIIFLSHTGGKASLPFFIFFAVISAWAAVCGGSNVVGFIMMGCLAIFFIVDKTFLIRIYSRFRLLFTVLLTLSLIVFLLVSFGVQLPYYVSPPPPRNTIDFNYYIYPFYASFSVDDWRNLGINRFNGLFDEPGVVGTVSFIILFIEKFNLKKVGNIVLVVSGLLSFSLFFYVASFIYIVYHFFFGRSRPLNKVISGVIVFFLFFQFVRTEIFQGYIGERFLWDASAKTIVGDDRSSAELKKHIDGIRWTSNYFYGDPDSVSLYQGSASLEKQILAYGFITVFSFFVFFILYSHKYQKFSKEWLLFLAVFLAVMYNRPTMFDYVRLFFYSMMIFAWSPDFQKVFERLDVAANTRIRFLKKF